MRTGCRETAGFFCPIFLHTSEKNSNFVGDMNKKFIIKWVVTFTVALTIYNMTGSFWMSLGILILVAIAESYVIDFIDQRKNKKK